MWLHRRAATICDGDADPVCHERAIRDCGALGRGDERACVADDAIRPISVVSATNIFPRTAGDGSRARRE